MADHEAGLAPLGSRRADFAVPPEVAYFNTANLAPQLHSVRAAGYSALQRRGQPWTISPRDWFSDVERLRALFAQVIGTDDDGVALVPATSYGFAVAARNLPLSQGQRVLVLAQEHPSGVYTWHAAARAASAEILAVSRRPGQSWTDAVLDGIDQRVAVVSVPNVHRTDGSLVDLAAVSARCRESGARLVIDGSQSIGAMPLDVEALRPDFVVSVGHKWLLGPFGVGYLYVAPEHRGGEPLEQDWIARDGSEDLTQLVDYRDEYQPESRRFDVGERTNFETVAMAVAALEQLLSWQIPCIAATLAELTSSIAAFAAELGLESPAAQQRGPHILGVRLPPAVRSTILPALAASGCYAAVRGEALRIAPHLHITDADTNRLREAMTAALR